MATNTLTGNYEAVLQVSTQAITALLGTLHQNGASDVAELKTLHSVTLEVGRPRLRPDLGAFGDWVIAFQRALRTGVGRTFRSELIATAPPGAAARLNTTFLDLDVPQFEAFPVRGIADVQISNLALTLPSRSTSEITLSAHIRAAYRAAPNTTPLPAPIHGEVVATFEARIQQGMTGRRLLMSPSRDDAKIQFHSATGVGSELVAAEIRRTLRTEFVLPPVDLPAEFPFAEFKGVGSETSNALAVGLQLSGGPTPAAGLNQVVRSRIGPSDFALCIGADFIRGVVQPALAALESFEAVESGFHVRVIAPPEIDFNSGSFDLLVHASAKHQVFGVFDVSIRQRLTLVLFLERLFIRGLDEDLDVSISMGGIPFPTGAVKSRVRAARDQQLPPAEDAVNLELAKARAQMTESIRRFDGGAAIKLRAGHSEEPDARTTGAIAITSAGIIVRGDLTLASRSAPVVDVRETVDETRFTAFESWVPSGRIDQFHWSWVEYTAPHFLFGIVKSAVVEHEFTLPKPAAITRRSQICLRVLGTVITPTHTSQGVTAGEMCRVPVLDTVFRVPSWWDPVMLPLWQPDLSPDERLRDAIRGHVSLQADEVGSVQTHNTLVYFVDWDDRTSLDDLGKALGAMKRQGASLAVILVLPSGAFEIRRRELDAMLATFPRAFAEDVHVTEDDQGGWARTFSPAKLPAAFLINARRQFKWKYEGRCDPSHLAAELDRRLDVVPRPRFTPLALNVKPGDLVLDASFADERGHAMALHRLRGHRSALVFWQGWSAPCRRELRRLQTKGAQTKGLRVFGFHGGSNEELIRSRTAVGAPAGLVQDDHHVVARALGVRCWPTTVHLDPDGRVEHVQFGASIDRGED